MGRRGDEELAVGVLDQLRQRLAPVGGVDPDDDRAGEGGADEPEQVVRRVVEEDADVGRSARVVQLLEQRGPPAALVDHLAERPAAVLVEEAGPVVVLPGQQQGGDGAHGRP